MTTRLRRRMALVMLSALAGLTGCTGGGGSVRGIGASTGGGTARPAQPAALLDGALSALLASTSVRISGTGKSSSTLLIGSQDSGPGFGRSVQTLNGGEQSTVLVVDGVGYIKGDRAALIDSFGFAPTIADRLADHWISFRPGDSGGKVTYQYVTSGITLAGIADVLDLTGPLTLTKPARIAGEAVIGVRGGASYVSGVPPGGTETVYIAASGRPLPVAVRFTWSGGRTLDLFSGWGEHVHLTAPANAVPVSSLSAGADA